MNKVWCAVIMFSLCAGAAASGFGAQKKVPVPAVKTRATCVTATVTATAAGTAATVPMNDDIYVEVKAHEVTFMKAALKDKQDLPAGTMMQKLEFAQLVQKKRDEFGAVRKKLLAARKVSEQDYAAYESKLTNEALAHAKDQLKNVSVNNLKVEDNDGFNARAQDMAARIGKRAAELEAGQCYK